MLPKSSFLIRFSLLLICCSCKQQTENYAVGENFKVRDFVKEDSLPALLSCNIAFDKFGHKQEFPYFIKISSKYKVKGESMYPTTSEIRRLDSLESATETHLKETGLPLYYIFRETHNGTRDFYFVTSNKEKAEKALGPLQKNSVSSPFSYTIITDRKWKLYDSIVKTLNDL